jgi:hypothetical protein
VAVGSGVAVGFGSFAPLPQPAIPITITRTRNILITFFIVSSLFFIFLFFLCLLTVSIPSSAIQSGQAGEALSNAHMNFSSWYSSQKSHRIFHMPFSSFLRTKKCVAAIKQLRTKNAEPHLLLHKHTEANQKDANMEGAFLPKGKTHPWLISVLCLCSAIMIAHSCAENNRFPRLRISNDGGT